MLQDNIYIYIYMFRFSIYEYVTIRQNSPIISIASITIKQQAAPTTLDPSATPQLVILGGLRVSRGGERPLYPRTVVCIYVYIYIRDALFIYIRHTSPALRSSYRYVLLYSARDSGCFARDQTRCLAGTARALNVWCDEGIEKFLLRKLPFSIRLKEH